MASTDEQLAATLYTGPEAFLRERRSIFETAWLLLARSGALQRPGDYVAHSLGGWPVFAIADASGAPRVFRNVCRHQKLPLFDSGAGRCEQIRCRYHGWTYDTAGRFISAPPQVAPSGALSRDLEAVTTEQRHGLLFAYLDESPPALAESLPALASALAGARLGTLAFLTETATDVDANWKLIMEQAIADHVPGVTRRVEWPSLILDFAEAGAVVHQVIVRSFRRTRIHHHHYGAHATVVQATAQVAHWKTAALARQTALETGAPAALPDSSELESFRSRVRAAHREG
jgi:phenylpropionate dioxygenase-like ring-hydroxylating dioxygenase large terminal subunit